MGLISVDMVNDVYCASGGRYSVTLPAIHQVLAEEGMFKSALSLLYRASGGGISTLLSNTPSGANTKVHIKSQNNLALAVDEICLAFGLTKEELAQICKIQSRKTLYNWINGESKPRKAAMNRIFDLLLTARSWTSSGFTVDREYLHTPLLNDQSLFDLLSESRIDKERILFAGSRINMLLSQTAKDFSDPFA